jgi:hypothetical protein
MEHIPSNNTLEMDRLIYTITTTYHEGLIYTHGYEQ